MKDVMATSRVLGSAELNEKCFSVLMGIISDFGCDVLEGMNLALPIESFHSRETVYQYTVSINQRLQAYLPVLPVWSRLNFIN